ncbi:MAG: DJ-1/PfpI family protein [Cyanobacteria bacterium SZAS TMP-1]|nr:DJ-1/PfpI family protein [Cyanobacteria bacterium SZAS TMP-1]
MEVQIVVFDGFDELDVLGLYEPLKMAGFDTKLLSLEKQDFVTASHGLKVMVDGQINMSKRPDVLCVPGGGWLSRSARGAYYESERGDILKVIKEFHKAGVTIAAVCTGALLVGKAGLLSARPAITNHGALDALRACGAKIAFARVVDDGDVVTAGGVTSSLDLGLWLIERFSTEEKAREISKQLEYVRRGPIWRSDDHQGDS